jgi:hypothetical protein
MIQKQLEEIEKRNKQNERGKFYKAVDKKKKEKRISAKSDWV